MSRVAKTTEKHHYIRIAIVGDRGIGELMLVGGPHPYLWIGSDNGTVYTFAGKVTLRKLAQVLLRETQTK
jgi:hypothetical protein